jgi:hypothetical protein
MGHQLNSSYSQTEPFHFILIYFDWRDITAKLDLNHIRAWWTQQKKIQGTHFQGQFDVPNKYEACMPYGAIANDCWLMSSPYGHCVSAMALSDQCFPMIFYGIAQHN